MSRSRKVPAPTPEQIEEKIALAEQIVGHRFTDSSLVRTALTHPSAVESLGGESFERFEFLGDAVIALAIREEVFNRFPSADEGVLTRITAGAVDSAALSGVAADLGLEPALIFSENEQLRGARGRRTALEDALEALVAALYLDAGMDVARAWVLKTIGTRIDPARAHATDHPKARLQELVQARGGVLEYAIVSEEGPPHERIFVAVVRIDNVDAGQGSGASKRAAETAAADAALAALKPSE